MAGRPPVHTVRIGAIQGSIWVNDKGKYPTLQTTFTKSYKTKDGEYKDTNFLTVNDLADLELANLQARLWIKLKGREALKDYAPAPQTKQTQGPPADAVEDDIPF